MTQKPEIRLCSQATGNGADIKICGCATVVLIWTDLDLAPYQETKEGGQQKVTCKLAHAIDPTDRADK